MFDSHQPACKRLSTVLLVTCTLFLVFIQMGYGQIKAKVNVIIDKLPLDKEEKMRGFDEILKKYVERAHWFEENDEMPVEISMQLFLTDSPSNFEDRYNCEFLISSVDVQYFDRRVRFPFQPGEILEYNEQSVGPLTGVIDFYVNMVLGNEFDKYNGFGGDFYYKRAQAIADLGKFVRTEFIRGWTQRQELIRRVFKEPFKTFRKMKDYYFYGLYVLPENLSETRKNLKIAFGLLETVMEKRVDMEEPEQFMNAHYLEIIEIFKDDKNNADVFKMLIKLDQDHAEQYKEHTNDS